MIKRGGCFSVFFFTMTTLFLNGLQNAMAQEQDSIDQTESITAQASDPNAPIMQFSITDFFTPTVMNADGSFNMFQIQPVIPIHKLKHFPVKQIVRVSFSVTSLTKQYSGINDLDLIHMFVPDPVKWGSWSIGYTFTFPTGKTPDLGEGKWQIGPAASIVYSKISHWQFGGIFTNSFSFAGASDQSSVNEFSFTPIINRLIGKWYIGVGDFVWTLDWNTPGSGTIPLGLQSGRITKIGKFNYNISIEFEYTAMHDANATIPVWGTRVGIVFLLPEKKN